MLQVIKTVGVNIVQVYIHNYWLCIVNLVFHAVIGPCREGCIKMESVNEGYQGILVNRKAIFIQSRGQDFCMILRGLN